MEEVVHRSESRPRKKKGEEKKTKRKHTSEHGRSFSLTGCLRFGGSLEGGAVFGLFSRPLVVGMGLGEAQPPSHHQTTGLRRCSFLEAPKVAMDTTSRLQLLNGNPVTPAVGKAILQSSCSGCHLWWGWPTINSATSW